ncbi:unnamed protein product [Rotaria socialis]|uniref:TOG domain-containing protein n=6 Tax=Rotaria TaxID=231623 RepID=A0A818AIC9_9BILA|nr:unnamed protein product [Rotaria socialis]CAF3370814.1 unnamed protein product [Rotaria socialis]CAF3376828.1 unnamed protein product [Rotaria socialis]CAF3406153.1 unnamed protein product [Rotaria socialis]CAF4500804.1 unnamed protein product [Rotaria socialis]
MATVGGSDDNEWQKLPPDQKVQHKAWKARMTGYEECIKLFRAQPSDQSPEFNKYVNLMKKFVIDSNENAREKALDAVFAFVEEANVAGKVVNDVASGLIAKCLNSRSKMRERGFEILLMYIEIEKQIEIEDELVKGLENKQPKIVQACLEILRKGLSVFGSKILPIKPFLKQVIPLLDDRDKTVRDESKLLLVEVYKWIGKQTLTPMIQNVKPIQMQELQTEFEKLDLNGADKPRQTRFLRSQQDLKERIEGTAAASSIVVDDTNIEMQEDLDPFEMIEPVNILERLSKDFFEKLESKQWKDRKEVLDDLLTLLTQNPKPKPDSDYSELVKVLKKIITKDSNITVVLVAGKCLTALAKGLRKAFKNYALGTIDVCLDRCREKKTNILEVFREACEAAYPATNLEQLSEIAVVLLAHKTPIVRQSTHQFFTKCFSMATQATLSKKILKIYLVSLIKNTGEADQSVRESAFECLGMLWKCLGEKHILPNLADMDELKLNKIKEYAEKSVLLNLRGEPRSTAPVSMINGASSSPVSPIIIIKQKPTNIQVTVDKHDEEPTQSKPSVVIKKKPIVVIAKPPTPPPPASPTKNELLEDKKKEARPPKTAASITTTAPRVASSRSKPTVANTSTSNIKLTLPKARPATAPPTKSTLSPPTITTTNTQRLVPIVQTSTTKIRAKPPVSTNRRSSFGSTLSSSTSNLQRQSTSTNGSTSSLSSTNTQTSIPCTRPETPTSSTTMKILRSVSNDVISSPNPSTNNGKSRIPIRAIPISSIVKKSLT